MELYVENDYYLTLWKKEDGKWFCAVGWSDGAVTWLEDEDGPDNELIPVKDMKHVKNSNF